MNRFLTISLILLAVSGCSPQKRLGRLLDRFPPDTLIRITIKEVTIFEDTTIFIELPGETVIDSVPFEVEVDIPYIQLFAETELSWAVAWIEENQLHLWLEQKDSILAVKLDSALVTVIDSVFIDREIPIIVQGDSPKFYKRGFWIALLAIAIFVITLIRRR